MRIISRPSRTLLRDGVRSFRDWLRPRLEALDVSTSPSRWARKIPMCLGRGPPRPITAVFRPDATLPAWAS
jgi:hypothetical protein